MISYARRLASATLVLSALTLPGRAQGQAAPLTLELRVGTSAPLASFATGERVGEGTDAGASFGLDFAFSGSSRRTLYVGFSQHRFPCADAGCRAGDKYVATGVNGGLRLNLRTRGSIIPWLRVGAVTTRVELPAFQEGLGGVSRLGLGGELGAGLYIGTGAPVALNPGLRLTAVNTELPGGEVLRMRYLVADFSLSLAF